ncbi:MAG: DsrE/DsrF/DrsH-like family protein [Caldiserica bacterium]|jgi:peroxiredoxin family protein|nr:DsrE/DsrF/DrsH-like family protein [Caldisericota bacterium]MDH7562655.1 DsrE/DsrF/DrsH-like family protein [Caldisericota bacterium]
MPEKKKLAIVVSENSLDKAMMPMFLGTAGAALDAEVHLFFTFWGLFLLKKDYKPKLKGMMAPFTGMMISKMKAKNIPGYSELLTQARELGVKLYACSTSMDMMGIKKDDLIEGVEVLGATAFLKIAFESDVTLFI